MDKTLEHDGTGALETSFIEELINNETFVSIFLRSGLQLKGVILHVDDKTLLLNNNGQQQLIFKHIISTICPKDESKKL